MQFIPKDMDVKTLFKTFPQFNIPIYQRDYSWDKQYYSKFLDDIQNSIIIQDGKINNSPYFIGTMVFSDTDISSIKDVVDGQQRLTVITILLSVIADKFQKIGEKDLAHATFKYVKDKNDNAEYFTHLKSETSYPFFDSVIQSLDKQDLIKVQTEEEKNLENTYIYFSKELEEERIKSENSAYSDFEYKEIMIKIRDQILSAQLISISTPDRDSAYTIFEILNAKGKNLASIDLIKNTLFEEFYGDSNGIEAVANASWEKVKRNLRERKQNIGLMTFYRQYWISKYQKVTGTKLYDSFKRNIKGVNKEEKKKKYFDFIKDMEKESERYIKIIKPILSEDYDNRQEYKWLEQSLQALNDTFGLVQTRVALLALLDIKDRELITTVQLKKAISSIENFVFMYTGIAKKPANIYESIFSKLAINLRKSKTKSETNKILEENLYNELKKKEIPYSEFEAGFIEQTYRKGKYNTNILTRYIIRKINCHFEGKEFFSNDNNSVEHIINEDSSDLDTLNIGNLIILEGNYNSEAGNLNFEEKLEIYRKSKNEQMKDFLREYPKFEKIDVRNRAKKLSKLYYTEILGKIIK